MDITRQFALRVLGLRRTGMTVAQIAAHLGKPELDVLEAHKFMGIGVAIEGEGSEPPRQPVPNRSGETIVYPRTMLYEFLTSHHEELIRRCRAQATKRFQPAKTPAVIAFGVPLFLQQLVEILRQEQSTAARDDSGPQAAPAATQVGRAAALHGAEMLHLGYSIDQVVHEYGDVCQSITEMAVEMDAVISTDEFRTVNRCLDDAIADAVTAFVSAREFSMSDQAKASRDRLWIFSYETLRLADIAIESCAAIEAGKIAMTEVTGELLRRTLSALGTLAENTIPDIRPADAATQG